jgi:polyisoprenoid-binding protein YceI
MHGVSVHCFNEEAYMSRMGRVVPVALFLAVLGGQAPVFVVTPEESTIKFYVKSSVDIEGHFDEWDATLTFTSPNVSTGVLDIKIQAASVNTGSGF